MDDFDNISDLDQLNTAVTEANEAATAFRGRIDKGETLTGEELAELEGHFNRRDAARDRITAVEAEIAAEAEIQAAVAARFDTDDAPAADAPADAPVEPAAVVDAPSEPVPDALAAALSQLATAISTGALTASSEPETSTTTTRPRVPRPEMPPAEKALADLQVSITAAGEAHGFAVGQDLSIAQVGEMAVRKFESMPKPNGKGKFSREQRSPLATIHKEYPEELQIREGTNAQDVFNFAMDQSRLVSDQGAGSLLAAGGWCSPSEQLYDLEVVGESLAGMWSSPEAQAKRGGIKTILRPDIATLYPLIGFHQTEAQAIAGTTKPAYELTCPSGQEVRLEVDGINIRVPILMQAAYPELVTSIMQTAMVVHAHRLNAFRISKAVALATAKSATDLGSSAESTLRAIELRAEYTRQVYFMDPSETLEVVFPMFARAFIKADLRLRSGNDATNVVDDAAVDRHLKSINIAPQWVYDYQSLTNSMDFPDDFEVLMYPAGTFLTLGLDVINLSTVYDAESLSTNVYTGLFSEEAVAVMKMSGVAEKITIPICSNGTMGANEFTCTP